MNEIKKLHVGCGTILIAGWINADVEGENFDVKFDLTESWPLKNNTLSYIYSEHVFEHLTPQEGQLAWVEALRVLKPNELCEQPCQILIFCVPYILRIGRNKTGLKTGGYSHIRTKAEMLNTCFYFWNHKWLYNFEEFVLRIEDTGFKNPVRMDYGKKFTSRIMQFGNERRFETYC